MMKTNHIVPLLIITIFLLMPAQFFAAIQPQVTLDMNLQALATHLKNEEYHAASKVYAITDKLIAEHPLDVEHGYYYYRAETMLNTGHIDQAYASLEKYLELTGTTGRYYTKSLQVLAAVEQEKQRLLSTEQRAKEQRNLEQEARKTREQRLNEKREQVEQQRHAAELKANKARKDNEKKLIAAKQRAKKERRKSDKIVDKTGIEFIYIAGGCFEMGSSKKEDKYESDETPQHKVCVDDFWMSKYEITNRQFRRFQPKHNSKRYKKQNLDGNSQPAVQISWSDARNYTSWLSKRSGMKVRLPTEAEWEYAARGGTATARFWEDSQGSPCKYANVGDLAAKKRWPDWAVHNCEDGFVVSAPVGSFSPNPFGLYDMLGNVWEWCGDWYEERYYSSSPESNPQGPSSGSDRIFRGGSWRNRPDVIRAAYRYANSQDSRNNDLGLRLVLPTGQ
jgi:formylglycine-generating enzyme required for sulfatase activity